MVFFFSASRKEYAQMAVRNRAPGFGRASEDWMQELPAKAASIGSDCKRCLRFMACLVSRLENRKEIVHRGAQHSRQPPYCQMAQREPSKSSHTVPMAQGFQTRSP